MNIMWLTPEVPYPPIGGRNGVYNRIVQLSKNNRIFLFSIAYNQSEKIDTCEMEKYCKSVNFYDRSEHRVGTLVKSVFYPFSVASRYRRDICRDLEKTIKREGIDLVIVDFPNMARNVLSLAKKYPEIVFTINEHNVEYVRMRGMQAVESIPKYKRVMYYLESLRLELYEKRIYKSNIFKAITFFSNDDCAFFKSNVKYGNSILKTIPLGANDYRKEPLMLNNKTLLFVGRLDHIAIPNVEAMIWFVASVWPLVKKKIPDAKLVIAGANPEEQILSMRSKDITIIPNFSDMEGIYDMTDIVIMPLLSGGGVKGKLLEAVAFRKYVVSTQHGIEGTVFKNKEHVLLANDEVSFAESCVEIMENPERYKEMESRAYELFKKEYDWSAIGKKYQDFLEILM